MKNPHFSYPTRPWLALLLVLMILTLVSRGQDKPLAAHSGPSSLVRLDFSSSKELQSIAFTAVHPLALLVDSSGQPYLLALATADQQAALMSQGYSLALLDADAGDAAYYLVRAMAGRSLEAARSRTAILWEDGPEAIVRAVPEQAEQLPEFGIKIARLGPEAIVLPLDPQPALFPPIITPHPAIAAMIDQVQSDDLVWLMERLTGETPAMIGGSPYTIVSRNTYSGTPIQKATQYVAEYFQALGLDVEMHAWSNPAYPNVIATIPGAAQPDQIVLITAHMDDMPSGPLAPGADDNASGTTAVMVAADLFRQFEWDCTLRFVAFTGEEQGLLGSKAYALRSYNLGENITGVINLDMIAYNSDTYPIVDLHARSWLPGSVAIAGLFNQVVTTYDIALTPDILIDNSLGNYSDNKAFWDYGYNAILGIEDYHDFTPYYHTVNDRLSTLDIVYFTNFVKASIGTLAHMGCLAPPPGWLSGTIGDAQSGLPIEGATIEATAGGEGVLAYSDENGTYLLVLEEGDYQVNVEAAGYAGWSSPSLPISSYLTTTLNLMLDPLLYAVTGTLRDAFTGQPLNGQVTLSDPAVRPVYSDPVDGSYTLMATAGSYSLTATATGYQAEERPIDLDGDHQQDFDLEPVCLLVVDTGGELSYLDCYIAAPDRLALSYVAANQLPDLESLAAYSGVTFAFGYEAINNPADRDQVLTAVVDYLSACRPPEAPQAAFASELLPEHGRVHLTNASQGTLLMQYEWAFGDGSTITATHSVHQYAALGAYTVTLTTSNTFGAGTVAMTVSIEPLGPIALQYEPAHRGVGEAVVFTAAVDQPYDVSCNWDFGDGNTAADSVASHEYATAGTYTVTVTASSTLETVSATVNLTVADPASSEWRLYLPFAAKP
jgi:PKD repeat protein